MASIKYSFRSPSSEIEPSAVYGHDGPIKLRIATGGAGQTGVLKALAEAFVQYCVDDSDGHLRNPFRIAWLATDTSLSFNALATKSADISITYHPYAETIALRQGVANLRTYLWRDAFCLVGPVSNPANLPQDGSLSVYELFSLLFTAAVETSLSSAPVRFLSRFDKSANNILESRIWATIGQTPWSHPYSVWYHRYVAFPTEALRAAAALGEYTLVDRGTWGMLRHTKDIEGRLRCYKEGSIDCLPEGKINAALGHGLEGDGLSNPAHALLSPHARDSRIARLFLDWMLWEKGGQTVIRNFRPGGMQLHGVSPETRSIILESHQSKL